MSSQRLSKKTLFGLIACNLVWSANPAFSKILLRDFEPLHTAWLRYAFAWVTFLGCMLFIEGYKRTSTSVARVKPTTKDWFLVGVMGFFAFCFSPLFQMLGLSYSRATDNALIVAIEPFATIFLAFIFLRERLMSQQILAFLISLIGFLLLTGYSPFQSIQSFTFRSHLLGNALILFSLFGEAAFSVFGKKLILRFSPFAVFGAALTLGFALLTLIIFFIRGPVVLSALTFTHFWICFYLGVLGTSLSYFYWLRVLQKAPVASLAITLFIQPVFGALWGQYFLNEQLNFTQNFGAFLILFAILLQNRRPDRTQRVINEFHK